MLLRLIRTLAVLGALVAVVAAAAPNSQVRRLVIAAGGAGACLAVARQLSEGRAAASPQEPEGAVVLDGDALKEAQARIVEEAARAETLDGALHGVAKVLKGELGAREVVVYRICGVDARHVLLAELVEGHPEYRTAPRKVPVVEAPLGLAVARGCVSGSATQGIAVPVASPSGDMAVLALTGIQVGVDAGALTALLELTRLSLNGVAMRLMSAPPTVGDFA